MQQPYNFDFFYRKDEKYQPSFIRESSRLHFFYNTQLSNEEYKNEADDRYKGFFSNFFENQIRDRAKELGYEDKHLITKEALFTNAAYSLKNSLVTSTKGVLGRVFGSLEVSNLFENPEDDKQFSNELLRDFASYIVQPRDIREDKDILPSLRELDSIFDQSINREISGSISATSQLRKDINTFQRKAYSVPSTIDDFTAGGYSRSQRLIQQSGYVNRPGILPAIGIIHDAQSNLDINIFQLQNNSVVDYLTYDILSRVNSFRENTAAGGNPDSFIYNIMLAYPDQSASDSTTYNILGPNAIVARRLMRLKELYQGQGIEINLHFADRKNHPKFLVSDNLAIIGSQNLTNPVGKSLYQAGSNYEALRMLQLKVDGYTAQSLEEALRKGEVKKEDLSSETLLYMQARSIMNRTMRDYDQKFLSTGQQNVGGPMETMELLRSTLGYANSQQGIKGNTKISAILDQVFLLQYESSIFGNVRAGEMGPEALSVLSAKEKHINQKAQVYQGMQSQFLDMLIEGRANVFVDVRNYRKNVQDPIFKKLNEAGILSQYGFDIENLVRKAGATSGSASERVAKLMSQGVEESMARQILAMTSGNIQTTAVPRQHVKAFLSYQGELIRPGASLEGYKFLSGTLGSSNLGLYSLGLGDEEIDKVITNFEMNLIYASEEVRNYYKGSGRELLTKFDSVFSLSQNQETEELRDFANQFYSMVMDVATRKVSQLQYTDVDNRAEYERNVDRKRLMQLYSSLDEINKNTGGMMNVNLEYDNRGPIALQVAVGNNLNYKFTALNSGIGDNPGFIYEINKSKVIGYSDFVNSTEEGLRTGFTRDGVNVVISPGQRMEFNPIETTVSLLSSIALEGEQIRLIRAPLVEYRNKYTPGLEGSSEFSTGIARYLLAISGQRGMNIENVLDPSKLLKGDIIYGALKNLQVRLLTSNPELDKVRQLAGINVRSEERLQDLTYLTDLIQLYGGVNSRDRNALLTGSGLESRDSIFKFLSGLLNSPQYADLLYDFINAQGDPLYRADVNENIKEVSNRAYDAFLLRTQVNTYGYTQAGRQKPVYGINQRRSKFRDIINHSSSLKETGISRLAAFALASSPYEYGPTSNMGKGNLVYMGVAEGTGSQEKTGLEDYRYDRYTGLLPYAQHSKIGDVSSLELAYDAGIANLIRADEQDVYREAIAHLGPLSDSIVQKTKDIINENSPDGQLLIFNFDTSKKASQIPQRLKNVKGSRPLMELTSIYQTLLDTMQPVFYRARFGNMSPTKVGNSVDLQQAYLADLRAAVGQDKAYLIDDSYGIGAFYGGKIRNNLSSDIAQVLEQVREQIESEFGIDTRDGGIGSEIFRVKLLHFDTQASLERGFIGSSQRYGQSVMLFQLGGAYPDGQGFLNPFFGGVGGMRQGFVDRSMKGHQASKLVEGRLLGDSDSWNFIKNLQAASGDIMALDYETNKVYVNRYNEKTGEYERKTIVDSRKEFLLLTNLIDKVSTDPSFTDLRATSNAASFTGEQSKEVIRSLRILEANPDSNEIRIELILDRTIIPGSRRLESLGGGLLKMNPLFLYGDFFPQLISQFNANRGGSFMGFEGGLDERQVMGLINPSNMKSYFYQHGAAILTDVKLKSALFSESNAKSLAASLLMAFGTDRFGNSSLSEQVLRVLGRSAASGELGDYFKDQYNLAYLQEGIRTGVNPTMEEIGALLVKGATPDPKLRDNKYRNLQVRTLEYLGLDTIMQVLQGVDGADSKLIYALNEMMRNSNDSGKSKEYIDIGSDRGRELALLAGTLDLFSQMTKAKPTEVRLMNAVEDQLAYYSLGTIGGLSYEELKGRQEELSYLVDALGNRSYVIGTYLAAAGSQSKVPLSSKTDSFIENQHIIWEPFHTNLSKFQKGGSVDSLRQLTATFFGSATGAYAGEFIQATEKMQVLDVLDPYVRSPIFKAKMMGVYSSPLVSDSKFSQYKQTYEMFGLLEMLIKADGFNPSTDIQHIQKIVKAYRENNKDLDNSLLSEIEKETQVSRLRSLIDAGYLDSVREFESMSEEFKRSNSREPGLGVSENISTGMQRSAGSAGRFGLSIPFMKFLDDGRIRFYKDYKEYTMFFAGEDTKLLGESFGGFENELLKDQILLWEAMSEGSLVSRAFDIVAQRHGSIVDLGAGDINEETYLALIQLREVAKRYPSKIQEALSGSALQKVFGNKIGFAGGTTTPAAMFLGSNRAAVLPEVLMERQGGGVSRRELAHRSILGNLQDNRARINNLYENKEAIKIEAQRQYIEQLTELQILRDESIENTRNKYQGDIAYLKTENSNLYVEKQEKNSLIRNTSEFINSELVIPRKNSLESQLSGYYQDQFAQLYDRREVELYNIKENKNKVAQYGSALHSSIQRRKQLIVERNNLRTELRNFVISHERRKYLTSLVSAIDAEVYSLNLQIDYFSKNQAGVRINAYDAIDSSRAEISSIDSQIQYLEDTYTRPIAEEISRIDAFVSDEINTIRTAADEVKDINKRIGENKSLLNEFYEVQSLEIKTHWDAYYNLREELISNKIDSGNTSYIKEQIKSEYKARKLLMGADEALKYGISSVASQELNNLKQKSSYFQSRLENLKKNHEGELNRLQEINREIMTSPDITNLVIERRGLISSLGINSLIREIESDPLNYYKGKLKGGVSSGDNFVNLLGLYEMETLRGDLLGLAYSSTEDYQGRSISSYTTFSQTFKNTPGIIRGLMIGSQTKDSFYIETEELQGEMKVGASKLIDMLGISQVNLAKMSDVEAESFIRRAIKTIEDFASEREKILLEEHSSLMGETTRAKFGELYTSLNKLYKKLDNRQAPVNGFLGEAQHLTKDEILDVGILLEGEIFRFHSELNLGVWQTNRPSPLGNPSLGLAQYDIFGLGELNERFRHLGIPISMTPPDGSFNRNSTAHIVNPIGWYQSQLGDFDGDMVINIKNTSHELKLRKAGYENMISSLKEEQRELMIRIRDAEDYYGDSSLRSKLDSINKRIANYEAGSAEMTAAIARVESNKEYTHFQESAAKFVGNYLKVDYRFFIGKDDPNIKGGFGNDTIDPSVLFTLVEQGRGLFGGMEDILVKGNEASAKSLFDSLLVIAKDRQSLESDEAFRHSLNSLDPQGRNKLYQLLRDDNSGVTQEVREGLYRAIQESGVEAGVANYLGNLYAAQSGTETIHKYNAKGLIGTAVTTETFGGMLNTLGQAGSIILGKTYNTMTGMLFTEAPNLALSYAILNDPNGELESMIKKEYGEVEGTKFIEELKSNALAVRSKAESMGAFLQATQQILRDSIKPKQADKYLNDLDTAIENYKEAKVKGSEADINKAYEEIVKTFGEGSGLKSLMQMEYLISDLADLRKETKDEEEVAKKQTLLNRYELTEDRLTEYLNRLGYNEKTGKFNDESLNKLGVSKELVVAAYKTKQDLVSMVSAFAYEKAVNKEESTGRSLLAIFGEGLENSSEKGKWEGLVRVAESYFQNPQVGTSMDEESAAYLDALKALGVTEEKYKDMSPSQKLYHAHVWMKASDQFNPTAGERGEGMIERFVPFNIQRQITYSNKEGRDIANSFDIAKDPLAVIEMMAATSGKLEPDMVGKAMSTLVNTARMISGNPQVTDEEIAKHLIMAGSLNETPEENKMTAMFLELASKNKKAFSYLLGTTRSMAFGQQADTIRSLVESSAYEGMNNTMSEESLKEHFLGMGMDIDTAERSAKLVSTNYLKGLTDPDMPVQQLANAAMTNSNFTKPSRATTVLSSLGKDSDIKSQAFIFPILGIIGQALATGDITPDSFQQAVGLSLANLSYVRFSNLEGNMKQTGIAAAANVGAGTAYKMRLALEENNGDAGRAIVQVMTKDLTMSLISGAIGQTMPPLLNKMFGGVDSLNFDRYENARSFLTSTITSVVGTLVGMMGANYAAQIVNPETSTLMAQLAGIRQAQTKYSSLMNSESSLEEGQEEFDVVGDNGGIDWIRVRSWTSDEDIERLQNEETSLANEIDYAFNSRLEEEFTFDVG